VVGAVDAVEPGCEGASERCLELRHQFVDVDGSLAAGFWIGRPQRLGDLVAQTDVTHDQAVSLLLAGLGPVKRRLVRLMAWKRDFEECRRFLTEQEQADHLKGLVNTVATGRSPRHDLRDPHGPCRQAQSARRATCRPG